MGFLKRLIGALAAGLGFFAVFKYLHDYTNFKAAKPEDVDELKAGTEKAKEAAKRTYVAIKESSDITAPAEDLGKAAAQVATGAGKVLHTMVPNAIEFAKAEKERYMEDPEAFKQQVSENLKTMQGEANELFENLKENAEGAFGTEKKENVQNTSEDAADPSAPEAEDACPEAAKAEAEVPPASKAPAEAEVKEDPEIIVTDDPTV